ncbi:pentachlorophenol monooxygenase [Streptomyces piniterrae]|uniref:Pentachlorophenol monooxygenase n=1 Tax=Streptomyces piniterrae TaxID=2571125 RepID=A0A4U0NFZ1_9ACTN|nr:FAD-dependent monooxygenase [Streptomyces piniterrae]TJZ53065.1 pentachlorophenol monooxygenase [Streptomyces piniterrae]
MELNNVKDALSAALTHDRTPGAPLEVLIAGAGPTGLALGIDLARRGVRALIVERQDGLSQGARGTGLQPRTQEVYDDLGVLDAVRAAGGRYPDIALWENGRMVDTQQMIERVDPTPCTPHSNVLMIPQWRHQELLHERLWELGGEILFGTELTDIAQDPDGVRARVRLADGSERTLDAAYLVAADGGRSAARKALGVGMSGPSLAPGAAVLADVAIDGLDRDHWHRWHLPNGGFVMILPLAGTDHFQCFAMDPDRAPDTSADAVRDRLAAGTHLNRDQFREVLWSSVYRPKAGMADRFRAGRVFLAGDAAHIHSPAGGQGLNTSVQDAYNLGWKLGQVLRHGAPDTLLDSYETERRPIAAGILDTSTRLHESRSWRRGKDLHQLGIGYPDSPLTRELRDDLPEDALRAGDRAPDAPCTTADGAPTRLFNAYRGPHFTLLTLGDTDLDTATLPADPPFLRTVRVGGQAPDLIDTDGHIRDAYGDRPAAFLIRPDGYLAVAAPAHDAATPIAQALAACTGAAATAR